MIKIGMVGILQNPSIRLTSHNAGWTFVYKSMLEERYGCKVDILTHKDDWEDYNFIYINEGVNFKKGQWNLFGGVNENLLTRLSKLENTNAQLLCWGHDVPDYNELIRKRNISNSFTRKIYECNIIDSVNLVLGDSHCISVYKSGWDISRNDGKTLHGFLKDGIGSYLNEDTEHVRFYSGNIDVRHHLCRKYSKDKSLDAILELKNELKSQIIDLQKKGITFEIVELLPIEDESRKIPKTGYYEGKPFHGSWSERNEVKKKFNFFLEQMCKELDIKYLTWDFPSCELSFENMEAKQSVHLAPKSYMFSYDFVNKEYVEEIEVNEPVELEVSNLIEKDISFNINDNILKAIDDYHEKSLFSQEYLYEGKHSDLTSYEVKERINDDLIYNVPIYDMRDRRYAAFSSFIEAIWHGEDDPKGNGKFFGKKQMSEYNWILLFYLFRLCGSGINYKPKTDSPFGSHGFGNFWLVNSIYNNDLNIDSWFKELEERQTPFTNNKGYMLPQISYKDRTSGHLKHFILTEVKEMILGLQFFLNTKRRTIIESVEFMNEFLVSAGYKKQNFVMSATMADIAEYFPKLIDPDSMIYAGTNAKKCINAIFTKNKGFSRLQYESDCIRFLSNRYNARPYSTEDSRLCDVIRYFQDYQSKDHIEKNKGIIYKNNSTLKVELGSEKYQEFINTLNK